MEADQNRDLWWSLTLTRPQACPLHLGPLGGWRKSGRPQLWAAGNPGGGGQGRAGQGRLPAPTHVSSAPALGLTRYLYCGCCRFMFWRACDKSGVGGPAGSSGRRTTESFPRKGVERASGLHGLKRLPCLEAWTLGSHLICNRQEWSPGDLLIRNSPVRLHGKGPFKHFHDHGLRWASREPWDVRETKARS